MARRSAPFKAKETKPQPRITRIFADWFLKKFVQIREISGKDAFELLVP